MTKPITILNQQGMHSAGPILFASIHSPYDSGRYKNHWYYGLGFPYDLDRSVRELHAIGQTKPIIITEIGFPTDPRDGTRTVPELQRDLQRSRDILRQSDVAGLMIWPFQDDYAHMLSSLYP